MVRPLFPRIPFLRAITSRASSAPILPVTRVRPLTSTPSLRHTSSRPFYHFSARNNATSPRESLSDPSHPPLPQNATFSQRLKYLIKSYGWYALGVYLVIGALDFGVAFAGVNLLGAEYVSEAATNVKTTISSILHSRPAEPGLDELEGTDRHATQSGQEGLYAMIVLAWTIHKTLFLPVRVGLTATFTPKLVAWLGRRGWAGKEGTKRVAAEMRERLRERRSRNN